MEFMKNKKTKKGFTLVELVVVIAVIATLSAVSIGAYFGVVNRSKQSADQQTITQINKALETDEIINGKASTPSAALEIVKEAGFDVTKLTPTYEGYSYIWNQESNRFVLTDKDNKAIVGDLSTTLYYNWDLVSKYSDAKTGYSVYLKGNETNVSLGTISNGYYTIDKGLDTGSNTLDGGVYFNTTNTVINAVVKTNGENFKVNSSSSTISHYGSSKLVEVESIASSSLYEYGTALGYVATKGHVVAKSGSTIFNYLKASNNATLTKEEGSTVTMYYTGENVNADSGITSSGTKDVNTFEDSIGKAPINGEGAVSVNGLTFETIEDALGSDLLGEDKTITLEKDEIIENSISSTAGETTIDLNGKSLSQGYSNENQAGSKYASFNVGNNSELTIKNGTIELEYGAGGFLPTGNGVLNIEDTTLISTGKDATPIVSTNAGSDSNNGKNSIINIKNSTFTVSGKTSKKSYNDKDGNTKYYEVKNWSAAYFPTGTVNIEGSTFNGHVVVLGGKISIKNSIFNSLSSWTTDSDTEFYSKDKYFDYLNGNLGSGNGCVFDNLTIVNSNNDAYKLDKVSLKNITCGVYFDSKNVDKTKIYKRHGVRVYNKKGNTDLSQILDIDENSITTTDTDGIIASAYHYSYNTKA